MLTLYQFYRKQKYADIFLSTWNTILYNVIQSLNIEYAPLWHGSMRPTRLVILSTRLLMLSWGSASHSSVSAWANCCNVWGIMFLPLMARPKASQACSMGFISGEQAGHGICCTSLGVKKFSHQKRPMWSCVVVLELEVISIYPSCIWKTLGLQDVTVDDGVDVSFRYSQWRFSAIVYSGPYHHWASTSLSGFTDAVISEVLAT